MKVVKQPAQFQPFDLRIESQAEADLLATLLANTAGIVATDVAPGVDVYAMSNAMRNHGYNHTRSLEIQFG